MHRVPKLQGRYRPRKTYLVDDKDTPARLVICPQGVSTVTTLGKILVQPDLYRTTNPKARKEHTCCECPNPIKPGERYELVEGLWDGDNWERFKTCAKCAEMRNSIPRSQLPYDGLEFGNLESFLANEVSAALGEPTPWF